MVAVRAVSAVSVK